MNESRDLLFIQWFQLRNIHAINYEVKDKTGDKHDVTF